MKNEEKILEKSKQGLIHYPRLRVVNHETLGVMCAVIAAARNVNLGLFDQDVYGDLENALEAFDKLVVMK